MANASRDSNFVPTLTAVSSTDGTTIVKLVADEVTGRLLVDATGGASFADGETPSGAVNGSNAIFVLANAPSPALSLQFFVNGQLMTMGGEDGTLSSDTVTLNNAPPSGSVLRAWYRY